MTTPIYLSGTQTPMKDSSDPEHLRAVSEAMSTGKTPDQACLKCRDMTLGHLAALALAVSPDSPQPSPGNRVTAEQEGAWGLQKAARAAWALKIENDSAATLTDPQAALLAKLISQMAESVPGAAIAQAYTILQPNTPLPEVK